MSVNKFVGFEVVFNKDGLFHEFERSQFRALVPFVMQHVEERLDNSKKKGEQEQAGFLKGNLFKLYVAVIESDHDYQGWGFTSSVEGISANTIDIFFLDVPSDIIPQEDEEKYTGQWLAIDNFLRRAKASKYCYNNPALIFVTKGVVGTTLW